MKLLGIELAPFCTPWSQRMQTLAVLYCECMFLTVGFPSLFFMLYLLFTGYYWIPLLYLAWFCYDKDTSHKGGRPNKWMQSWRIFKYYNSYFPIQLVKTAEMPPDKNYLLGAHPHGAICMGHFNCFSTEGAGFSEKFPGITSSLLTLEGQFWFPFFRELFMQFGASAATRENLDYLLSRPEGGHAPVLIVGGASEALNARPGAYTLVIKRRRGFIKTAIRNGASLVPVFSFGETDILEQVPNPPGSILRSVQEKFKKYFGFVPALFMGRGIFQYSFGLVPFRRPIYIVVGKPIEVEKNSCPSEEQVNELHQKYLQCLWELFEENKAEYCSDPNPELIYT